ncbi:Fc.00g063340.m01.CDS01 [Cosmosporella sp. VM-42]
MFAARQRAGCVARQLQRTARTYAHDAHHHAPAAPVNESFGVLQTGSIVAVTAFFGTALFYAFRPQEGEESAVLNFINQWSSKNEHWEEINALHTRACEQAGFDRNLFEGASNKHRYVDVAFPEAIQSHSARNIRAGQINNMDHVVEHYRQQHLKEEDRKLKKLAAQQ